MKFKYSFILLFLFGFGMFAQSKDEREARVKLKDFPINAQTIVKELPKSAKRLKLYKEFDGDKISYEAKFKYKKNRYSVEFDTFGTIEDVEVLVGEKDIPIEEVRLYLESNFDSFKSIKIQKQYINAAPKSDKDFLLETLRGLEPEVLNYELIVEVKLDSKRKIMEVLFNKNGKFKSSRDLKPSSYEHIMY